MRKLLTTIALGLGLSLGLLLSFPTPSRAGGIDIRLTVVSPVAGLRVAFSPEGATLTPTTGGPAQPLLIPLTATDKVEGINLPCSGERCYTLPRGGRITGNIRGGIIIITQCATASNAATTPTSTNNCADVGGVEQLVARDAVSWTFTPGTVADLVAFYSLSPVGELKLADFRRTDVPLTPVAYPHLAPEITPLVGGAATPEVTATNTLTNTATAGSNDSGMFLGCGIFLVLLAVVMVVGWWLARPRTKGAAAQPAN